MTIAYFRRLNRMNRFSSGNLPSMHRLSGMMRQTRSVIVSATGKKEIFHCNGYMGNFDDYIVDKLKNSDIMVIEANHDVRMLEAGPYPYYLKQRILGNRGHLSNERSGQLIKSLFKQPYQRNFAWTFEPGE